MNISKICKMTLLSMTVVTFQAIAQEDDFGDSGSEPPQQQEATTPTHEDISKEIDEASSPTDFQNATPEPEKAVVSEPPTTLPQQEARAERPAAPKASHKTAVKRKVAKPAAKPAKKVRKPAKVAAKHKVKAIGKAKGKGKHKSKHKKKL